MAMTDRSNANFRLLEPVLRQGHWYAAAAGMAASVICAGFIFASPLGEPASSNAAAAHDNNNLLRLTTLAGATFNPAAGTAPGAGASEEAEQGENVHRAGWREAASPGCLTITTEDGEKLSFRISGYKPGHQGGKVGAKSSIELSVSSCAKHGKTVIDAIFEPDAATIGNDPVSARNL